ncbi:MAG: hypothetical protein KGL37_11650, partial [Acidobacteriota bacterium]|nr:hypothetical protein [Acidobacteriota bacterium]
MKSWGLATGLLFLAGTVSAQAVNCDLQEYKSILGVTATANRGSVELTWPGERGEELRARFTLRDGQPVIEELAARKPATAGKPGGAWIVLGKELSPEFQVTTGRRRISTTELNILKKLGKDTPENEDYYKWNVFWDAPLEVPGYD